MPKIVETCGKCKKGFTQNQGQFCEEHKQPECNFCRSGTDKIRGLHPIVVNYKVADTR